MQRLSTKCTIATAIVQVLHGAKSHVTLITNVPACVQMNARSDHVLITPQRTIQIQIIANTLNALASFDGGTEKSAQKLVASVTS